MLGLRSFHVRELVSTLPTDAPSLRRAAAHVQLLQEARRHARRDDPLVQLVDGAVVALDSKVTVDDNALFRHPDVEAYKDATDRPRAGALNGGGCSTWLDGNVGIIGNGAGLVMSLDVVAQAGAKAANFLDVGGGRRRPDGDLTRGRALRPRRQGRVHQHLGGITRCDHVAHGVLGARTASRPRSRSSCASTARTARRAGRSSREAFYIVRPPVLEAAERAAPPRERSSRA